MVLEAELQTIVDRLNRENALHAARVANLQREAYHIAGDLAARMGAEDPSVQRVVLYEAQLLQQTGFSTTAELQAAMDDYRRFCESLPDGADVPSLMEYLNRPSPTSDVARQMRSEVDDRSFESKEELQQFLDQRRGT